MDPGFFTRLTKKEALAFLNNYISEASQGFRELTPEIEKEGIQVNFSLESLPSVVEWFSKRMTRIPGSVDTSLPDWITGDEDYLKGLYSFDEASQILVLRLSYYWGECFVKSPGLEWSTGISARYRNQPVIIGFYANLEMAPFELCNNHLRALTEGDPLARVHDNINYWVGLKDNSPV